MAQDTDKELSEAEARRIAAQKAVEANQRRNNDRLARMEQIADQAEQVGEHVGDQETTEDMWKDHDLTEDQATARAMKAAEDRPVEEEDEEEDTSRITDPQNDQTEERADDSAREAGAEDVKIVNGEKHYLLIVNGKEKWLTLAQIRASAQKVEAADEYLQTATDAVRKVTRAQPSQEEAEEQVRAKSERKAHIKDLLTRSNMGDEQAIEELAETFSEPSVTPDVLRSLDERFDSRVTFREAVNWFESEYETELRHPAMKLYAGKLDSQLAEEHPNWSPKKRLQNVGEQVRRELKDLGFKGVDAPSAKAQRKAEVRRPTPAGERRVEKSEDTEEESTQSVIQKMAQGRHQPRAVVHGPIKR